MKKMIIASVGLLSLSAVAQSQAQDKTVISKATTLLYGTGHIVYVSKLPLDSDGADNGWKTLKNGPQYRAFCSSESVAGDPAKSIIKPFSDIDAKGKIEACDQSRFFGAAGDNVRVLLLEKEQSCAETKDVSALVVKEEQRKTLIASEVIQLVNGAQASASLPGEYLICAWAWDDIILSKPRSNLTIGIPSTSKEIKDVEFSIITGPKEHWFLSGDVVVKGASAIKYDAEKKTLNQKNKPDQIYLGINYMVGDVYGRIPSWDVRRIVGKMQLLGSKNPFNSVGLGIGYRFSDGDWINGSSAKDHSGFVVFVSRYWTKGDKIENGSISEDSRRSQSTRFGISYSLGTALDWVKK